jgi:hypothetical protein
MKGCAMSSSLLLRHVVLAAGLAALAAPVFAAPGMKPGLWEFTSQMHSPDGKMEQAMAQAQKQMAAMPPEQRKMVEDMMAKHGVSMNGSGVTAKVCVTKEMAARNEAPVQTKGNCTTTRSPMVGNTMKMHFTCTNPASAGDGEITFQGDNAYHMHMTMTGKQAMSMDADGHYLGSACGSIAPMDGGK